MNKLFLTSIVLLSFTIMDASANQCPKALDFEIKRLGEDKVQSLCQYKGKVILVVNTASKCGFTPQYEGLEKLYSEKKDEGLVVLGFPSHDFYQEPAPEQEIKDFCNLTYDVKFPMFTKVNVRGANAHPFYKNLAIETNSSPKWNFWKYLINKEGKVVKSYSMVTSPDGTKLVSMIDKLLSE
jgi:glutathione peroxidase